MFELTDVNCKGAVIKYDWEGGGRNLNFSAKYFVLHEENILYFHVPVNIFDLFHTPVFVKEVLAMTILYTCII